MSTSHQEGTFKDVFSDEGDHDSDAVINERTTIIEASSRDNLQIPPRRSDVFGLPTPESPLRPDSFDYSISSPRSPLHHRNTTRNVESLQPFSKPFEQSSEESTTSITLQPTAGLQAPTPENTPLKPIPRRENINVQSESSPSPETPSIAVAEIPETSSQAAEALQDVPRTIRSTDEKLSQRRGTTPEETQCGIWVNSPVRYCGLHKHQDTGPDPQPPSLDPATDPATGLNEGRRGTTAVTVGREGSKCSGTTKEKRPCRNPVRSPDRYCRHHKDQDTGPDPQPPSLDPAADPATGLNEGRRGTTAVTVGREGSKCSGTTKEKRPCRNPVRSPDRYCGRHKDQDIGTNTQRQDTAANSATELNRGITATTVSSEQRRRILVESPDHYYEHHQQQDTGTNPQCPPQGAAINPETEQNERSRSTACRRVRSKQEVKPPAQRRRRSRIPTSVGTGVPGDVVGFILQQGQGEVLVHFRHYIPPYLQPDTQLKLRAVMTRPLTKHLKSPGYVYVWNVVDPKQEGKISWKVGCSIDVKRRYNEWKGQCSSYIQGIHGWWPGPVVEPSNEDYHRSLTHKLLEHNQQGDAGPMAHQLERLVHLELRDLATHAPYLHPKFPDIKYYDVERMKKIDSIPCSDCGEKHKEIFSFRRVQGGEYFGREWEDIVKPVIKKWGTFLEDYFAEA